MNRECQIVLTCWPRVINNVLEICRQLETYECLKTVLDVSGAPPRQVPGWEWISIDPQLHYGGQFRFALKILEPSVEIFVSIVGDMETDDWTSAVAICLERFAKNSLIGIWSAEVDHTAWPTSDTALCDLAGLELTAVVQTDCCVWALRRPIFERIKKLDLSLTDLGWGIDWAASVFCYTSGFIAVRDKKVSIHHPSGTGYIQGDAAQQSARFLQTLPLNEKLVLEALRRSVRRPTKPVALKTIASGSNGPSGSTELMAGFYSELLSKSKAQLAQDIFVLAELRFKHNGFFVEFGATNGINLSNTHLLEKEFGWKGILAEPAISWHEHLRFNRSAHIETKCVWSDSNSILNFNEVSDPELSTVASFSDSDLHSEARKKGTSYQVETISLNDLLGKYNAPKRVDYLSIDTEGSELTILECLNFDAYEFSVITCEHNGTGNREKIHSLLRQHGYVRKFEHLSKWDDWYVRE